jgi:hypothetical protein
MSKNHDSTKCQIIELSNNLSKITLLTIELSFLVANGKIVILDYKSVKFCTIVGLVMRCNFLKSF